MELAVSLVSQAAEDKERGFTLALHLIFLNIYWALLISWIFIHGLLLIDEFTGECN